MLDINFIKENKARVQEAVKNKNKEVDIERLLELDEKRREARKILDEKRQERNENSAKMKSGGKPDSEVIEKGRLLKEEIQKLELELERIEKEYFMLIKQVPNVTDPGMPVGKDDSENISIRKWGEISDFDFKVKDHIEIGESLDLIDVDTSGRISGSRFYYLKNEAVLLQFAIVQLVFETLTSEKIVAELAKKVGNSSTRAFVPIIPPFMMKPEIMAKMDRLDPIEDRYELKLDDLILIGSAEHTLGPIHMDSTLPLEELPIRYIGYSPAFRREAGSHGQDVRGILRAHQFDKLEMESFTSAENGAKEQDLFVAIQEYLVQKLKIPYQVLQICTGDTGKPDYNQFDIECWIPSQQKYRETHTSDYMTDYQARRLNTRYVDKDGSKKFVHMNDATAFAIGRILIAILENYQQKDGSVIVPEVLRKYVGKDKIQKD